MKNLNLLGIHFLSFILFSSQPKKEKEEPITFNNNQNYKYDDDDELTRKSTNDFLDDNDNFDKKKAAK